MAHLLEEPVKSPSACLSRLAECGLNIHHSLCKKECLMLCFKINTDIPLFIYERLHIATCHETKSMKLRQQMFHTTNTWLSVQSTTFLHKYSTYSMRECKRLLLLFLHLLSNSLKIDATLQNLKDGRRFCN
jgi:hypothetical protein